MECPACHGKRTETVLAHMAVGGCQVMDLNCFTCHGTGEVSDDYPERMVEARRYHDARVGLRLSLHEVYDRTGVDYVRLSQFEHHGQPLEPGDLEKIDALYASEMGTASERA